MSSLINLGLKVGYDFLIVGFDDMKYAKHLKVPLTTYRQPVEDIGKASINIMLNRLRNIDEATITIALSGSLVIRESSSFTLS